MIHFVQRITSFVQKVIQNCMSFCPTTDNRKKRHSNIVKLNSPSLVYCPINNTPSCDIQNNIIKMFIAWILIQRRYNINYPLVHQQHIATSQKIEKVVNPPNHLVKANGIDNKIIFKTMTYLDHMVFVLTKNEINVFIKQFIWKLRNRVNVKGKKNEI